ncbi:hypothetical protein [Winogradskyella sp. 3972H.M.0a.05]|uniref:hypothetical protein n=1 Tax=Winogradskyella sp. 3972H.M.0a.05 TaxID=2950277 RepID=UPI00339B2A0E
MMKTKILILGASLLVLAAFIINGEISEAHANDRILAVTDGCVFQTLMGEQSSKDFNIYKNGDNLSIAVNDGLEWISKAQLPNGGFGAGSHNAQHVRDPHAVKADPATTSMVVMSLLRSNISLKDRDYGETLKKAINYLLETVENTPEDASYITTIRGTQIQSKLGQNIDAVLTAQLFSNLISRDLRGLDKKRIERCLDICVAKIQQGTDNQGRQKGAGWAGVLQSGLANSALESAQSVGIEVDNDLLEKAKNYQKANMDDKTGSVRTEDGAGIMLYAVSNTARASAKDARKAKEAIITAKAEGKVDQLEEVTVDNLKKAGFSEEEAIKYNASYNVYNSAKVAAQRDDVMKGFGNNGGEEFLSFLQTGESLAVNQDEDWKKWYDNMSGRILKIQNEDGSWNGHHCITSPVFCTATSLMLLTIENDIEYLKKVGE